MSTQYCGLLNLSYINSEPKCLMEINLISHYLFWTLDVSRTVSYEITLIGLSVRLSVPASRNFLKIGSLVFSDIIHDDS